VYVERSICKKKVLMTFYFSGIDYGRVFNFMFRFERESPLYAKYSDYHYAKVFLAAKVGIGNFIECCKRCQWKNIKRPKIL
jgi:hypothetical protein